MMTLETKELLKKEIKKVLKKNDTTAMFYMTKKQMENNTATICVGRLYNCDRCGNNLVIWDHKKVEEFTKSSFKKYKELLKDFPLTIETEIKTEYGLDYLYIRLNY